MKFKLTGEFNDLMNSYMDGDNEKPLSGPILNENVSNYTSFIMGEASDILNEVFSNRSDLKKHYLKHVMSQDEKRTGENRNKYDYMTKKEYSDYANSLKDSTPDFTIDDSISEISDAADIIDEFENSSSGILKIDYPGMKNMNNHDVFAIYNRKSKYSSLMDFCLVDKTSDEVITLFPIRMSRFSKHVYKFLGE